MAPAAETKAFSAVRDLPDEWALPEGSVPQSVPHTMAVDHLSSVLTLWARRAGRPLFVARDLALRWVEERPQIGIDPDVCLLDPPPADVSRLRSLCSWKAGHVAPPLAFEIVSENHPYKDYVGVHQRYAMLGTRELVVFDPLRAGPKALGGPFSIQVWRRDEANAFERQYAGPGPVFCDMLAAWLLEKQGLLELSDDPAGTKCWPTEAAFEREEKERARADAERERAARVELERRIATLQGRSEGRGG